jgi:hypothetical protein
MSPVFRQKSRPQEGNPYLAAMRVAGKHQVSVVFGDLRQNVGLVSHHDHGFLVAGNAGGNRLVGPCRSEARTSQTHQPQPLAIPLERHSLVVQAWKSVLHQDVPNRAPVDHLIVISQRRVPQRTLDLA